MHFAAIPLLWQYQSDNMIIPASVICQSRNKVIVMQCCQRINASSFENKHLALIFNKCLSICLEARHHYPVTKFCSRAYLFKLEMRLWDNQSRQQLNPCICTIPPVPPLPCHVLLALVTIRLYFWAQTGSRLMSLMHL